MTIEMLKKRLSGLSDGGYVLVGVKPSPSDNPHDHVILMVHSDWKEYNHRAQFEQAYRDLGKQVQNTWPILEIPTLDMFEKRWSTEDHGFEILYDGRQK